MGWVDAQRYITGRPNVEIITRARRRYQYHPWRMGVPLRGSRRPNGQFFLGGAGYPNCHPMLQLGACSNYPWQGLASRCPQPAHNGQSRARAIRLFRGGRGTLRRTPRAKNYIIERTRRAIARRVQPCGT